MTDRETEMIRKAKAGLTREEKIIILSGLFGSTCPNCNNKVTVVLKGGSANENLVIAHMATSGKLHLKNMKDTITEGMKVVSSEAADFMWDELIKSGRLTASGMVTGK